MSKTIMVIEDSASVRQVLKITLRNKGYDVIECIDGVDALGKMAGQQINLFLCDLNMPNMDGLTFVQKIKENPNYKFTPIIMLTTESEEDKKIRGMEAGVKAWLVKPFQPDQLLAAISKLIR